MGFIEETGAAQHYRDARIAAIYEGTNGIQALDLVTRKVPLDGGKTVALYLDELRADREGGAGEQRPGLRRDRARGSAKRSTASSARRNGCWRRKPSDTALAGATPYLRLFGNAAGGCMLAEQALAALRESGEPRGARGAGALLRRKHRGAGKPLERTQSATACYRRRPTSCLIRAARRATGRSLFRAPFIGFASAHAPRNDDAGGHPMSLKGKTLFITGGSRGIGLAIALQGRAPTAPMSRSRRRPSSRIPSSKAPSTPPPPRSRRPAAARSPLQVDVREEDQVKAALDKTAQAFGGIDIVVNNASAIQLHAGRRRPT